MILELPLTKHLIFIYRFRASRTTLHFSLLCSQHQEADCHKLHQEPPGPCGFWCRRERGGKVETEYLVLGFPPCWVFKGWPHGIPLTKAIVPGRISSPRSSPLSFLVMVSAPCPEGLMEGSSVVLELHYPLFCQKALPTAWSTLQH